jgi:hypothetical protein
VTIVPKYVRSEQENNISGGDFGSPPFSFDRHLSSEGEDCGMAHITVDGRIYDLDKLSEPARQQAMNIDVVDQEIRRLQIKLVIYQTARNAYVTALHRQRTLAPGQQMGPTMQTVASGRFYRA